MQHPEAQIVGETVAEEIRFVLENRGIDPAEMDARIIESLTRVGLDVDPEQPTAGLSGGQKQLLAIAGSLAAGASLLLFDEAASMLDPESADNVLQTVTGLHRSGATIVWVTQNMDEVGCGGRVAVLENGRVVYDGDSGFFLYGPVWETPVPAGNSNHRRDGSAETVQIGAKGQAPCERYGYEQPFTVLLVNAMLQRGVSFPYLPLTMRQFSEVVRGQWTSL
jgi:energy-coupling factor transporter ATP-binding protein EcfA2